MKNLFGLKTGKSQNNLIRIAIINMIVLLIGLTAYWLAWFWIVDNVDMTVLEDATTSLVYGIQSFLGSPVEMQGSNILFYSSPAPGFGVRIFVLCLGIGEMLFFSFLVLLFRGTGWKTKGKGLAIFLPLLFVTNIIRLVALYPMAEWLGIEAMWGVHWHIWKWGMFVVIMLFFTIWYLLFARKSIEKNITG